MPILKRRPKVQGLDEPGVPSPNNFRPSAPVVENEDGYVDGTERDGMSTGVAEEAHGFTDSLGGPINLEHEVKQLLGQELSLGFAVVQVDLTSELPFTLRGAGRKEMLRLIRQAMRTLRELNSHPSLGVSWRVYWILAELADFGIHLRWTSPHVPFLE